MSTVSAVAWADPDSRSQIVSIPRREVGPEDVLIDVRYTGVCHSDLHVRDGDWKRPTPIVMGHEGAGIVDALGPDVDAAATGLHPGQVVALSWVVPCGACRSCRGGRSWECRDSPSFRHGRDDAGGTRLQSAFLGSW